MREEDEATDHDEPSLHHPRIHCLIQSSITHSLPGNKQKRERERERDGILSGSRQLSRR